MCLSSVVHDLMSCVSVVLFMISSCVSVVLFMISCHVSRVRFQGRRALMTCHTGVEGDNLQFCSLKLNDVQISHPQ